MKIVIADDHALVRAGLTAALRELPDGFEVLEAKNVSQVRELTAKHRNIVCVLLDLKMPGMEGLSGLRTVHKENPQIPVAILSGFVEPREVREALDIGAAGYISKAASNEVVVGAIELILAGGVYLPPVLLEDFEPDASGAALPESQRRGASWRNGRGGGMARLTARQTEVFERLRQGKSNKEIARNLGLSEGTVKKHVSAILSALDVTSRTKAICAAEAKS